MENIKKVFTLLMSDDTVNRELGVQFLQHLTEWKDRYYTYDNQLFESEIEAWGYKTEDMRNKILYYVKSSSFTCEELSDKLFKAPRIHTVKIINVDGVIVLVHKIGATSKLFTTNIISQEVDGSYTKQHGTISTRVSYNGCWVVKIHDILCRIVVTAFCGLEIHKVKQKYIDNIPDYDLINALKTTTLPERITGSSVYSTLSYKSVDTYDYKEGCILKRHERLVPNYAIINGDVNIWLNKYTK